MAIFRKMFVCDTVASSGGKCFKKIKRGQINPEAGLYDANDNLVASWDTLLVTYGMDEVLLAWGKRGSPSRVLNDNGELVNGTKFVIDESITSIGFGAFENCKQLKSIHIPESVTGVANKAFMGCTALKSVVIPNGVDYISASAFCDCTSLTSIVLPASVTEIALGAFSNCTSLTDVYYKGTEEQWNAIEIWVGNECLTNATIHYNSQ